MSITRITGLVVKALFRRPYTRRYPFVVRAPFKAVRGHVEVDINTCTLCTLCQKKCPTGAITVDREGRTWAIERMACLACSACVDCCPKKSIAMLPEWSAPGDGLRTDVSMKPPEAAPAPAGN